MSASLLTTLLLLAPQSFDRGFTRTKVASNNGNATCEVGPDGHLYVGDVNGRIRRYRLDATGAYTGTADALVSLTSARILGIAFDPDATATNLVCYASVNLQPRDAGDAGSAGEWNGKIVRYVFPRVGQAGGTQAQDKIVSLPTGFHDVNGIAFGPDKMLYVCAGSTTTLGGTGRNAKDVKEKLLSAAVLQADVKTISGTLNVKTEQGGSYNPYPTGAKVKLYATGLRNAYDCAWLGGNLYAGINQNDVNGNTGGGGGIPNLNDIKAREPLVLVRSGKYYGHVNAARGEWVHMGGNPTSAADAWEIPQYPVGTRPLSTFDPSLLFDITALGGGSADGCVGYDVPGPLQGRLVVCFFGPNGGGKVMTFSFGTTGRVSSSEPLKDGGGANLIFNNPLDVALHPNGSLYVVTYGTWDTTGTGGEVFFLRPVRPAAPPSQPSIARSPTALSATVTQGQNAAAQTFQVWNSGTGSLSYSVSENVSWMSVAPANGTSSGSSNKVSHTVTFSTSGLAVGTHTGTVTVSGGGAANSPQTIPVTVTVQAPANTPPVVNAGPNQTVAYPAVVTLNGTVSDDGRPNPPGAVTASWTKQTGPGTVTFANAASADTTATFSTAGTYVLRLTASDGSLQGSADITITLTTTSNRPPVVTAGADRTTIAFGQTVNLSGSATDDGLPNPPGRLTYRWTISSGPSVGLVTFANETSASTTASFSDPSTYILRLTASDGELTGFDEVAITVQPAAGQKKVLFVVGSTALNSGDAAVEARLEAKGYAVTLASASAVVSADAQGAAAVVISSSCVSTQVNTKFRTATVPVITWEAWLYDDLGMTGPTVDTDYGLQAGQTRISIVNSAHPLAGGLTGTPTVATTASEFMWGVPNGQAAVVATLVGNPGRAAIFAYEAGASMPGLRAPARRVGLYLSDTSSPVLGSAGWASLDAAVVWAAGPATAVANADGAELLSDGAGGGGSGGGCGATGWEWLLLLLFRRRVAVGTRRSTATCK